jgi:hypothetical protein
MSRARLGQGSGLTGRKLAPAKGQMETPVIDHVENLHRISVMQSMRSI